MNTREKLLRLHFQTLAPPFAIFIAFVICVAYGGLVISKRFKLLQENLSTTEEATRSLLMISKLRGDLREQMLLYRHTRDTKYLGEINDLDLERTLQTTRFQKEIQGVGANEDLINGFVAGTRVTKTLEYHLLNAIASRDDVRASMLFQDYSDLYEINGARLADLHALTQARLTRSEAELHTMLRRLPIQLLAILLIGTIAAWGMTRFYHKRVLLPLDKLHRGLRAVAQGHLGEQLEVVSSPVEIQEMLQDFNDMTVKLNKTSTELTAAREEAERYSNIKGEFLANMSHEIRTPLNVIIGLADLIQERNLDHTSKCQMEVLRKSGDMLLNIVNDILDYSKLEAGHVTAVNSPVDLPQTIRTVAAVIEPLAQGKSLEVAVQISLDVPRYICGDQQLIEQMLMNLANNAVKFTSYGGITIQARVLRERLPLVLELSVIDTGIGIPADKINKLFSRFEQAHTGISRIYGGTGLGLAIVKQIATLLHGEVKLSSTVGEGSIFTITLPLQAADPPSLAPDPNVELHAAQPFAGFIYPPNILLADDSEDNRFVIHHYLKPSGVRLCEVKNGREAVAAFKANVFDLVLMDVQMPDVDGYQATRQIRVIEREMNRPHTPVIALTAFAQKEEIKRSMDQGCDAHATKPIRKAELLQLIQKFIPPNQS